MFNLDDHKWVDMMILVIEHNLDWKNAGIKQQQKFGRIDWSHSAPTAWTS